MTLHKTEILTLDMVSSRKKIFMPIDRDQNLKRLSSISAIFGLTVALLSGCNSSGVTIPIYVPPGSSDPVPTCDGSEASSSTDALSFGGTGGCIDKITTSLEYAAYELRKSDEYKAQTISNYSAGPSFNSNSLVAGRIEYAHALDITGNGKLIAIRDEGFDPNHIEFTDKTLYFSGGMTADTIHKDSHGTAVAALAAGSSLYGETSGVAPEADLLLSSWIDDGAEASAVQAAEAAGAIAQNNSWGFICEGDAFDECGINDYGLSLITSSYRNALTNYAGDEGVVVFSASNEEDQTQSTFMAALPSKMPALEEGWLTVINLAREYDPSYDNQFRDRNSDIALISSGCMEAARWCIAADGTSYIANANDLTGYAIGTGTSYAAPRVSGAIALLSQAFPTLTSKELRNRLLVTADNGFFASDTGNISTMTFAEGITHDYHWVYGHGFLDVRAALLPIGSVTTTAKSGQSISFDQPLLVSGQASGDAVKTALSDVSYYGRDALEGGFAINASSLAASLSVPTYPVWQRSDPANGGQSTFDMANGITLPLEAASLNGLQLLLPRTSNGDIGARFASVTSTPQGDLSFAVSHIAKARDDLGLAVIAGNTLTANQTTIEAEWTHALSDSLALGVSGLAGVSRSGGNELLTDYETLAYNSLAIDLTKRNLFAYGDTLNLFLRQPVAVISGSATFSIETAGDGGKAALSDLKLDFAPNAREFEIGFDYLTQGPWGETWAWSASHKQNAGNYAGVNTFNLGATVSLEF